MSYTKIKRLECCSKKRAVVIEVSKEGLFRFVEWQERVEEDFDGRSLVFWTPIHWSGLFESAEAAERDAMTTRHWLTESISH